MSINLPTCQPAFLLACLAACLPAFLPSSLPARPVAFLPPCLPTCLPACQPASLPPCLLAYQTACLQLELTWIDFVWYLSGGWVAGWVGGWVNWEYSHLSPTWVGVGAELGKKIDIFGTVLKLFLFIILIHLNYIWKFVDVWFSDNFVHAIFFMKLSITLVITKLG